MTARDEIHTLRESVGRIIDPHSFLPVGPAEDDIDELITDMVAQSREDALRKADRVLALLASRTSNEALVKAEAEIKRLKSERLYIVGVNDGYDAAMDQAAQFCDGAEASWRETADKAHELDHNEALGWSDRASAKAETCSGLADTIRNATRHPLIRGVGMALLNEPDDAALSVGRGEEG